MPATFLRGALIATAALLLAAAWRDVRATDRTAQRERFPLAWEAARHGPERIWHKLAAGLEDYPLYPYLPLASMQQRMDTLTRREVDAFLAAWPDTLPAKLLREDFLRELARRGDWKNYLALYTPADVDPELACNALHARIALGGRIEFARDLESLWNSPRALPPACQAVTDWARQHGELSTARISARIDRAAAAANASLIDALASWLDGQSREDAQRLAAALREPAKTLDAASQWPDGHGARAAAALAIQRLARRDSDRARDYLRSLRKHLDFSAQQLQHVQRSIAVYEASSYAADAGALLAALPAAARDDASREWRVRVALAAADWPAALAALDALAADQAADARWRYVRARVLAKLGRDAQARPLFEALAREANFHGFLAADWINAPYSICPSQIDVDKAGEKALLADLNLARAFEFFALGHLPQARREWTFANARLDPAQRRAAAVLASRKGWYDRAVYAFAQGDDLRLYEWRFPLARREQVLRDARAAGVSPAWAYAIIRAESAWTSDARSAADAWGLMQLLPGTARLLAKNEKVSYSGPAALFDPDVNIRLGTLFLGKMAQRYDGSPWLASAAYNAGPDPVDRWINARDALEPDFFIETMPYKETREYVARVLAFSVIYDWRLNGKVLPLASRLPRIGQAYEVPPADAPRKAVVCSATEGAPASAYPSAAPPGSGGAPASSHSRN